MLSLPDSVNMLTLAGLHCFVLHVLHHYGLIMFPLFQRPINTSVVSMLKLAWIASASRADGHVIPLDCGFLAFSYIVCICLGIYTYRDDTSMQERCPPFWKLYQCLCVFALNIMFRICDQERHFNSFFGEILIQINLLLYTFENQK